MTEQEIHARARLAALAFADTIAALVVEATRKPGPRRRAKMATCEATDEDKANARAILKRRGM